MDRLVSLMIVWWWVRFSVIWALRKRRITALLVRNKSIEEKCIAKDQIDFWMLVRTWGCTRRKIMHKWVPWLELKTSWTLTSLLIKMRISFDSDRRAPSNSRSLALKSSNALYNSIKYSTGRHFYWTEVGMKIWARPLTTIVTQSRMPSLAPISNTFSSSAATRGRKPFLSVMIEVSASIAYSSVNSYPKDQVSRLRTFQRSPASSQLDISSLVRMRSTGPSISSIELSVEIDSTRKARLPSERPGYIRTPCKKSHIQDQSNLSVKVIQSSSQ